MFVLIYAVIYRMSTIIYISNEAESGNSTLQLFTVANFDKRSTAV